MKIICQKFKNKIKIAKNNIIYSYNGKIGINEELTFEEILNSEDKKRNKISILVYDNNTQNLFLKFKLNDYNIIINFTKTFDIRAEYGESLNKKIYISSFSLEELKNKSKFFRMFDSVQETYKDIKLLLDQNSFYIRTYEKSITLCIKNQIGIEYDIVFPLQEGSVDIKEIVNELCEKNINLEKKVDRLEKKIIEINEINLKHEKKIDDLEKQIKSIISNEKSNKEELKELIENNHFLNDGLTSEEKNKIKSLINEKIHKKFNLLYNVNDRE